LQPGPLRDWFISLRDAGAKLIEINPENTSVTQLADVVLRSPAVQTLPQFLSAP